MTLPEWSLVIDSDDDVSFSEASIVVNVLELRASLGLRGWDDRVAAPAALSLLVDDRARLFSPESTGAGAAYPGRWIRLQATHNSVTYTLWTGVIDWIAAFEAPYTARIEARGRWQWADVAVEVPLWLSATASEVVAYVLDAARFRGALRGANGPYWVLGVVGASEVGTMTVGPSEEPYKLVSGVTDELTNYGGGVVASSARSVIQQVTAATWARFYEDALGNFVLSSRQTSLNVYTPAFTFSRSELAAVDYRYGDVVYNRIETRQAAFLRVQNQLVWQNAAVQRFRRGLTRRRLVLTAADGQLVQIVQIVSQVVEFRNSETGGAVVDVDWRVLQLANGFVLEVDNQTIGLVYLQIGAAQIRADVLIRDEEAIETFENGNSVFYYGARQYVLNAPPFADPGIVENMAQMLLYEWSAPVGRVHSLTLESWTPALLTKQLDVSIDDVISVTLADLNHSRRYVVRGLEHRMDGVRLQTQLWLAPQGAYWIIGVSQLDVDAVVAY